jgi:hypothetical protein
MSPPSQDARWETLPITSAIPIDADSSFSFVSLSSRFQSELFSEIEPESLFLADEQRVAAFLDIHKAFALNTRETMSGFLAKYLFRHPAQRLDKPGGHRVFACKRNDFGFAI